MSQLKENYQNDKERLISTQHTFLIALFLIIAIASFVIAFIYRGDIFTFTIFSGFGVSFFTATLVSVIYQYMALLKSS